MMQTKKTYLRAEHMWYSTTAGLSPDLAGLLYFLGDKFLGLARSIYMYIWFTYSILAGKSPNIRSYAVYIYGSGQPYKFLTYSTSWCKQKWTYLRAEHVRRYSTTAGLSPALAGSHTTTSGDSQAVRAAAAASAPITKSASLTRARFLAAVTEPKLPATLCTFSAISDIDGDAWAKVPLPSWSSFRGSGRKAKAGKWFLVGHNVSAEHD
jgi:hypothetical protein